MKEKKEERIDHREDPQDRLGLLLRMAGPRPVVPDEVCHRVQDAVHLHWKHTVRSRGQRRFFFRMGGVLAACVLVYAVLWNFLTRDNPEPFPLGIVENLSGNVLMANSSDPLNRGKVLLSGTLLESDESGRLLLRLMQGPTLRMDVSSRLRLKSGTSFVLEKGSVYFDGTRSDHTVSLETRLGTVRDIGTQFEVQLGSDSMRIRVREGSVVLDQDGRFTSVAAGKQLNVNAAGAASVSDISSFGLHWQWISEIAPPFRLEGSSLMEFLNWVTRENGWHLEFSETTIQESAPRIILHGSVHGLRPDQMPEAVLPVCGLRYKLDNGVLKIHSRKQPEEKL